MNDQLPPNVTPEDMAHARAYVQDFLDATHGPDRTLAVARVLQALLPAPPRPTLAGMTDDQRRACQWMQADVENRIGRYVIVNLDDGGGEPTLIAPDGKLDWRFPEYVTPRPDLPRMTWPGDKKPAPALPEGWRLADHEVYGRVIVTTSIPNHDGRVYFVFPSAWDSLGYSGGYCTPDKLTYLDQWADTSDTVPPNTLAEGSEWRDVDAMARACRESDRDQIVVADKDGDVHVWNARAGWWESGAPSDEFEPYTIIHDGRNADQ